MPKPQFILEFKDVDRELQEEVGEKAANLGELVQAGFPVPEGFILPRKAFTEFIEQNNLRRALSGATGTRRAKLITDSSFPDSLKKEIIARYDKLGGLFKHAYVAVRPSLTSDDPKNKPALGLESVLDTQGEANLLEEIKKIWFRAETAIIIQKLVDAEVSGVAFTVDPYNKHLMLIEAIWGLGELATSGQVTPDSYLVERHDLKIKNVSASPQNYQLGILGHKANLQRVPAHRHKKQKLKEKQILELAKILQKIHVHYYFGQNVEWAMSKGKFYLLHVRPLIALSEQPSANSRFLAENWKLNAVLLQGLGASPGIVTGTVRIVDLAKRTNVKKGEIIVLAHATPDLLPLLKTAGAVVTDQGGVTSHAAIITRELGIPCVVGTGNATNKLHTGQIVKVNGREGTVEKGSAIAKVLELEKVEEVKPREDIRTATRIYLNLTEPEQATKAAKLPVDGVGLLRAEFMLSEIGVHPRQIITQGKQEDFVEKLANNLEIFTSEFDPRPVIYRTSDLKTNEYRNLHGGKAYEQQEDNPLLGFRGAARYLADPEVFEMELAAVKRVRDKYPNLWLMLPYVRTPQELLHVKRIMAASGLVRGASLKLWMMVELPVNVILIDYFLKVGIDGISFGTNDLTMLLTGTDRDNTSVAQDFDQLSPALTWSLERVIKACKKAGITTSICGEGASTYDTLVENLVTLGITSISVDQNALGRVQKVVYEKERKLISGKN